MVRPFTAHGALGVLVALAVVALLALLFPQSLVGAYERAMLWVDPSAGRAYEYGVRHFDANAPDWYDIDRAERYFEEALSRDPSVPLARHELARIAFLRGDLQPALRLINEEIATNPAPSPTSYYMRALIKGYSMDYLGAAKDYEAFFSIEGANWGAINDYAWVLLKANIPDGARAALEWGLNEWPENPWLLHNYVIALYELGRYEDAAAAAGKAALAAGNLTEEDWRLAYPGNDPAIAHEGLTTFRSAIGANQAKVEEALAGR